MFEKCLLLHMTFVNLIFISLTLSIQSLFCSENNSGHPFFLFNVYHHNMYLFLQSAKFTKLLINIFIFVWHVKLHPGGFRCFICFVLGFVSLFFNLFPSVIKMYYSLSQIALSIEEAKKLFYHVIQTTMFWKTLYIS